MKLKPDFVPMDIDETSYLVPVGGISFQGVVRGNETAGAILKCLREETTVEDIAAALCKEFNAPREEIAADVAEIVAQLRGIGALEE